MLRMSVIGLVLCLASVARADLIVVGEGGRFTTLQAAADAAQQGDTLLLRGGTFPEAVHVAAKGLDILAYPGELPIVDRLEVVDLPEGAEFVLAGVLTSFQAVDCGGFLRLSDCRLQGSGGLAGVAATFVNCHHVGTVRCRFSGNWFPGDYGNAALRMIDSHVSLHDGYVSGGRETGQLDGSPGIWITNGRLYMHSSTVWGGDGSHGSDCQGYGNGGPGILLDGSADGEAVATKLHGGFGGWGGGFFSCDGYDGQDSEAEDEATLSYVAGPRREFEAAVVAPLGARLGLLLSGVPGDEICLLVGSDAGVEYLPSDQTEFLIDVSPGSCFDIARIPESGSTYVELDLLDLFPTGSPSRAYIQPVFVEQGLIHAAGAQSVTFFDCSGYLPDCNGNGLGDACDTLWTSSDCNADWIPDSCQVDCNGNGVPDDCDLESGLSLDLNENQIPDECEPSLVRFYVDGSLSVGGDGSSWGSAFNDLHEAFAAIEPLNLVSCEVWVAQGIYRTGDASASRYARFAPPAGCFLYGGFQGTEAHLFERDVHSFPTILSGDLDLDGTPGTIDPDDSFGVIRLDYSRPGRLDGLTVQHASGGTLAVSRHTTANCCFRWAGSQLDMRGRVFNVRFEGLCNDSLWGAGAVGCGGEARFVDCQFLNNSTAGQGGAIQASQAITLERCTFVNNVAREGGAVYGKGLEVHHCLFLGNRAENEGGAIYCQNLQEGSLVMGSCTLVSNASTKGMCGGLFASIDDQIARVENSLFWGNSGLGSEEAQQILAPGAVVQFSLLRGWTGSYPGSGSSGLYPEFVDYLGPDGLAGTGDEDLQLRQGSPAVDSGRNILAEGRVDLIGVPRFLDDPTPDTGVGIGPLIDRGAYERRPYGTH